MHFKFHPPILTALLILMGGVTILSGQNEPIPAPWPSEPFARLDELVQGAVGKTVARFSSKKLGTNEIAVSLVDLRDPKKIGYGSYRGGEPIYPASVIKLFYLVAAHRWMEDGKLADTEELRRAMHDMIVDSYNEATGYVVDLLTETTSGPELSPTEIAAWFDRRNAVNRYFSSLGYTGINANKKPWCEGPYGRETQAIKVFAPKRNVLTVEATARIMTEIFTGRAVSPGRCDEMKKLMRREPLKKPAETGEPDQGYDFMASALPPGSKLWSKAGWTSDTRHDAAYVELPDGTRFILVIFTVNHANEREIIPSVAREVIGGMIAPR